MTVVLMKMMMVSFRKILRTWRSCKNICTFYRIPY